MQYHQNILELDRDLYPGAQIIAAQEITGSEKIDEITTEGCCECCRPHVFLEVLVYNADLSDLMKRYEVKYYGLFVWENGEVNLSDHWKVKQLGEHPYSRYEDLNNNSYENFLIKYKRLKYQQKKK